MPSSAREEAAKTHPIPGTTTAATIGPASRWMVGRGRHKTGRTQDWLASNQQLGYRSRNQSQKPAKSDARREENRQSKTVQPKKRRLDMKNGQGLANNAGTGRAMTEDNKTSGCGLEEVGNRGSGADKDTRWAANPPGFWTRRVLGYPGYPSSNIQNDRHIAIWHLIQAGGLPSMTTGSGHNQNDGGTRRPTNDTEGLSQRDWGQKGNGIKQYWPET